MDIFKPFALYAGTSICLAGIIFAGIRLLGGRFRKEGN